MSRENDLIEQIDTELYLRDGYPHATVCKVQLKDGRIGVGLYRQKADDLETLDSASADAMALLEALENVPEIVDPTDTQAALGQPAHS